MPDYRLFFDFPGWWVFGSSFLFFSILYFGSAFVGIFLCRKVLPAIGIGEPIDRRPLKPHQQAEEITNSLISIVVFGLLLLITKSAIHLGIVHVIWEIHWSWLPIEILILFFINEVHFYACHRLLHISWLYRKVHIIHHRSVIPTPFSTYSFHFVEAFILGSVMLTAMLLYDFSFLALLSLPVFSIISNVIGHMNYDPFPQKPSTYILAFSKRHSLHHTMVRGNYGFLLPVFDSIFDTSIPQGESLKMEILR